ncbi:hypothetical protein ENTCAN_07742 [Enterobacter cancerogenus ATCC 35316]|nr:hypothetical protein ENTCAN_07742 [Enterobacter cancerogenus ATCC 35316]
MLNILPQRRRGSKCWLEIIDLVKIKCDGLSVKCIVWMNV